MKKEESDIALLEGYAAGHVEYHILDKAVCSSQSYESTDEAVKLFNLTIESLELAFWRQELKEIAKDNS